MDPGFLYLLLRFPRWFGMDLHPIGQKIHCGDWEADAAPFVVIIDLGVGQLGSPCGVIKDLMVSHGALVGKSVVNGRVHDE